LLIGNEGALILLEYRRYLLPEIALDWCEQYSDRGQDVLLPQLLVLHDPLKPVKLE